MARARLIAGDIFADEWFGSLQPLEQVVWIGLFTACADDQGRLIDNAKLIRSTLFAYQDTTAAPVEAALCKFAAMKRIYRYHSDGKALIQIVNWWEHQKQQWAAASKYAPPPGWCDHVRTRENNGYKEDNWLGKEENAKQHVEWIGQYQTELFEASSGERSGEATYICLPSPVPVPVPVPEEEACSTASAENAEPSPPPAGSADADEIPGPVTFQDWQSILQQAEPKNRIVLLRDMFVALYPNHDPPDYGYIGRAAKAMTGTGRLAELLWQHSTRPPSGDVLAYLMRVANNNGSGRRKERPVADGSDYLKGSKYADLIKH